MPTHRTADDFALGDTEPQPRMRVNRSAPLTLTPDWQRLEFTGTSPRNGNSFPVMPGGTRKVVWDAGAKLFRFMDTVDRNYDIRLATKVSNAAALTLPLLSLTWLQLRFVVPVPNAPVYFPLPESDKMIDLYTVSASASSRGRDTELVYANADIRQYGLGIDLRLSNIGTTFSLVDADCSIYAR